MKKLIFTALLAILSLSANAQQPVGTVVETRFLRSDLQWQEGAVTVEVRPGSNLRTQQNVQVNLIETKTFQDTVITTAARFNVQELRGFRNVEVPAGPCETQPGTGQSPLWNAYFSAPKSQKGLALANAVAGIGEKTGDKIVADGRFFRSKPRSWEAFSSEAGSASAAGLIAPGAYQDIVGKFAHANQVNLGYLTRVNCPTKVVSEPVWELVDYPAEFETQNRAESTVRDSEIVILDIDAQNPTLQSFEVDRLTIITDRRGNARVEQGQSLTSYAVSTEPVGRNGTKVTLVGQGRNMNSQPPQADLFAQRPTLIQSSSNPNRVFLKFEINGTYFVGENNPETRIEVTYFATQTAGPSATRFDQLAQNTRRTITIPTTSRYAEMDIWGAGRNRTLRTDVSIKFVNSKWYTGQSINVGTAELRVK
jgi:hypothetical protein